MRTGIIYYENYSPVGDLTVLAISFVFIILIRSSFISRTKNFLLFCGMIGLLMLSSVSSVVYHVALNNLTFWSGWMVSALRILQHLSLFGTLFLYVYYVMEPLHLDRKSDKRFIIVASIGYLGIAVYEILGSVLGYGFYISRDGEIHEGFNIFPFGYLFFMGIIIFLLLCYRNRMFRQIIYGILGTFAVSILILSVQGRHHQTSFTTVTFLFPMLALLYMIHANPYDIEIGAVNETSFDDTISYYYVHEKPLLLMSLFMHDFEGIGKKYPRKFQNAIRRFSSQYFKGATLFQISNGHMILAVDIHKNGDYEHKIVLMLQHFADEYIKFHMDYKIVILRTEEEISKENDYIKLIRYVGKNMQENEIHYVNEEDVKEYKRQKYVLKELKDIYEKSDLEDSRVKVYCQPVYNIDEEKYDTAEALMRMELPEIGMVFPDQFIPLAEQYGYIHTLSKIILHKTCRTIHNLLAAGYVVNRISVNISAVEVREPDFCQDILKIVGDADIPFECIAIELTESQNESDFMIVRE
ncbi:MAG: EAL domain-containing protein, partial [Lachnospiraceae bacterium]|nr:EAL domain-containing protein [Lachnospiraceae bacterium]